MHDTYVYVYVYVPCICLRSKKRAAVDGQPAEAKTPKKAKEKNVEKEEGEAKLCLVRPNTCPSDTPGSSPNQ